MYRAEVDVERTLSRYREILDETLIYLNVLSGPHKSYSTRFCNASGQDEAGPLKNLLVGAHVTWESLCELTDRRPANLHHSPCPEGGAGLLVLARTASRILAWPSAKLLRKAIGLSLSYTHLTCQKNPSFLSCGTRNVDLNILITTEFLILRQKLAIWFLNEQYFIPTLPTECFSCVTLREKVQKAIVSQVQRGFVSKSPITTVPWNGSNVAESENE